MQASNMGSEIRRGGLVLSAAAFLCAAGCMASPPKGPVVEGPTLTIEIATLSWANVTLASWSRRRP